MPYVGGAEVTAADLRDGYPLLSVTLADVAVNQTIDWEPIPGLTVICAPKTIYAMEGFIAWDAPVTPGIRVGINIPANSLGRWAMHCVGPAVTTGIGDAQAGCTTGFGPTNVGSTGGSSNAGGALYGLMRGFLQTGNEAGSVQMIFTQNVADAAFVAIKAGSWISLSKMGTS